MFEFLRNGAMNARNFYAPVPDHLKRNQYGATIGGPIIKDKTCLQNWNGHHHLLDS